MENNLKGKENWFKLGRGSCWRGFALSGVDFT